MNREAGLASLLRAVGPQGEIGGRAARVFSLLRTGIPARVRPARDERIARTRAAPGLPGAGVAAITIAAAVPWDDLPLELKESNRTQADHIATKLEAVGCHIVPLTALESDSFSFTPEEVERLAEMEHERWLRRAPAAGMDRRRARPGRRRPTRILCPGRSSMRRAREMNRNSVRRLPFFLNRAGFTAHRYSA